MVKLLTLPSHLLWVGIVLFYAAGVLAVVYEGGARELQPHHPGVVFAYILAILFVVLVFVLGYLFPVLRPRRHIPEEDSAEGEAAEAEFAERGRTT